MEDITEHKRAERFLSHSSRVLASSLDPEETLQRIARLAVPDIADWCTVDLRRRDGSIESVALAHADPRQVERAEALRQRYPPDPHGPQGVPQVLRTRRSELFAEIPQDLLLESAEDEEHARLLLEFRLRSAMIVPMVARSRTLGALTFVSGPSGRRFDERDLELAEELARRCATALDNAGLYAERAYIAKTLQDSLLPAELPTIPGFETAARFHATGDGNEVGGDFYDLFETGARGWTVVVGDVCGKGPDAAAVTALARGDTLVFYTDGVTEARGARGVLGERRLASLVASCAGLDAEAIAARIESAALEMDDEPPATTSRWCGSLRSSAA